AKPSSAIPAPGSDKEQDGLSGPVNRVRTETSKLSSQSGKLTEGPRELLELTVYDRQGRRIDNAYYLVAVNSQPGEEQYQYNEKGNVSEMTLRGAGNEMLRKEAYAYEYDALGNWVKMVISTLVYEDGKLTQQPTEVAYRNITYFFDQAIADIVNSNSSIKDGASSVQNAQGDFASLRGAFDDWLAATIARDLERLLKFYSPRMEAFYRARNVSQDIVRADRTRLFEIAEAIEVKAEAPEITMSGDGRSATMHFNKEYFMRAGGRVRQGKVVHQLRWQLTDEGWKIVSERDIKVLSRS
ncbi:MAG: nuclear transport factor 2 family protein, partial [Pyrinomonadaceae bacterium]|nr:nuclear transport factor 2 family protein [Pyrinomonadaceae bacterium]